MIKYILIAASCFLIFRFLKVNKEFANPYKLIMIFGKKGSGKTTLLVKNILHHQKEGWTVYCTIPVNIPGVRYFDINDFGLVRLPEQSSLHVDEVGMIWDNRDFKNFKTHTRDYFKLHRHYKNKITLYSQTFDVDLKIRNLVDIMYMCRNIGNVFSIAHRITRKLVVVEPTGESEGRIADGYQLDPLWLVLLGMKVTYFTYIPKYTKYFNSFALDHELPEAEYTEVPLPEPKERKKNFLSTFFRRKANVPTPEQNDFDYDDDFKDIS